MARSTGAQRLVLGFLNRPPSNMYVGVWMPERLVTDNKPYIWRKGRLILTSQSYQKNQLVPRNQLNVIAGVGHHTWLHMFYTMKRLAHEPSTIFYEKVFE